MLRIDTKGLVKYIVLILFLPVSCSGNNPEIEVYMKCPDAQGGQTKQLSTSEHFLQQSGKSEVCALSNIFLEDSSFLSISLSGKEPDEFDEEFDKAFAAIDNLVDIPGEVIEEDGAKALIRLTDEGTKVLSQMTKQSEKLYVVVDNLVVTNIVVVQPIDGGELELIGIGSPTYSAIEKVVR